MVNVEKILMQKTHHSKSILVGVCEIYKFSKYFFDPNRHQFKVVERIMAYVLRFINSLENKRKNQRKFTSILTNVELKAAEDYFLKK